MPNQSRICPKDETQYGASDHQDGDSQLYGGLPDRSFLFGLPVKSPSAFFPPFFFFGAPISSTLPFKLGVGARLDTEVARVVYEPCSELCEDRMSIVDWESTKFLIGFAAS